MASMSKAVSPESVRIGNSDEESSWTFYFEDFLCNNDEQSYNSLSSGHSLVSDAASSSAAAKKFLDNYQLEKSGRNLSFKKRKTKGPFVDDALEDTASSPVNSPKVCHLNQLGMPPKEKGSMDILEEVKGIHASGQTNEFNELGTVGRDGDSSELKKRGLCLVPLSMLSKYLG
ncbi:vascular-related unknown protein 1-like [Diospyros lotus]|uniref:vascular-related unknown protein 1-like n=1 Tax=Diospyros lotus TaxID=55363 RepID=UPI00225A5F71|nr:vascular-related unknown protein 1-like [Diospyros lotus]